MPHAAPIPALPAPVSPTLLQQGGAYNKAIAPTQAFGEIFREQAGPIQDPALKATSAAEKNSAGSDSQISAQKVEASSVTEQTITEQAVTEQPESASADADISGSSQAQLLNQSHWASNSQANTVKTLAEVSETSLSAPTAESPTSLPTESPTESKDTNPSSSAQAVHLQHKTKEASQAGKPSTESATPPPAATPTQFILPVIGSSAPPPAMQPVTASSAADQTSTASDGDRTPNAANTQKPTGEKQAEADSNTPPQGTSSEGYPAASAAPGTQQATSSVPGGVSQPAAHGSADDGASSKESSSAALPSALAPHGSRAVAEQAAGGATVIVASSATPAEAHSSDAGSSSPAPPRLEQPAPATSPAASPATTAAPNLYDKIDQGTAPVVLHSGAQQVAVGVHDPGLGWVEIKTQNMAGHVDATLVTASGQTHTSLAAQLPAMAQYLEQRDVRVGTLAVHHQMPGANTGGQSGGSGNGGAGAQHPNHSNSNSEGLAARYTSVSPGFLQPGVEEVGSSLRPLSYISVRA